MSSALLEGRRARCQESVWPAVQIMKQLANCLQDDNCWAKFIAALLAGKHAAGSKKKLHDVQTLHCISKLYHVSSLARAINLRAEMTVKAAGYAVLEPDRGHRSL